MNPANNFLDLPKLTAGMDMETMLEAASEMDERGPLASIAGLLGELRLRHASDDTTLAILAAVEHYHLPMLIDHLKES